MDTLAQILFVVIFGWLVALLFIGPFQVIAALNRAVSLEDWNSEFGIRLKKYFWMLIAFWAGAGTCIVINEYCFNIEWMFFMFVPVLSTAMAVYYWRAIYIRSKKNID